MSEDQKLLVAAAVFIGSTFAYATIATILGQDWYMLMAILLLPFAALVATFIHKKLLS